MNSEFVIFARRSESNICDSPRQYSPGTRQRCIIAEHQRQLHREMLEMHDTLTRGLRTRCQLPVWDSSSIGSWKSSVRSIRQCKSKKGISNLFHHSVAVNFLIIYLTIYVIANQKIIFFEKIENVFLFCA